MVTGGLIQLLSLRSCTYHCISKLVFAVLDGMGRGEPTASYRCIAVFKVLEIAGHLSVMVHSTSSVQPSGSGFALEQARSRTLSSASHLLCSDKWLTLLAPIKVFVYHDLLLTRDARHRREIRWKQLGFVLISSYRGLLNGILDLNV